MRSKFLTNTSLINAFLIFGMLVLVLCGFLVTRQLDEIEQANIWIVHTHQVIENANASLLALTDSESRLTYYVLTKNAQALQAIPKLDTIALEKIALLKKLTQDSVIQSARVNELSDLANSKIALRNKIIAVSKLNKGLELELATSQERQTTKAEIIRLVSEINQEEINLLEKRHTIQLGHRNLSNIMLITFVLLSELFLFLSLIILNYSIRQRNIAEKKRSEVEEHLIEVNKALKASDERYLLSTEGSSAGLWDWEVGTQNIYYSSYMKRMLGYSDEEFPDLLQSFEKIIHPDDYDRVSRAIKHHIKNHTPLNIEYRLRLKLGIYKWFQSLGQAIWNDEGFATRMSGSLIDIDARKAAETKLRESEEFKSAIFQAASDAIIILDAQHRIISVNQKAIKEFGYADTELFNMDIQSLVPNLNLIVYSHKSNIELEARRKNETTFPVEIRFSNMNINDRNMSVIILRDVTERKKVDKMKNEFISVVSHELRTPLTSIRGALGLIAGGAVGKVNPEMQNLLDIANSNCQRLLLLISDILDVEKLKEAKLNIKVVDFTALVKEAINTNKMFAEKYNVNLVLNDIPENISVKADPDRLMQVLTNLISNAAKFSNANEDIVVAVKKSKESVRCLISNKGPGIPLNLQPQIFGKFVQADTSTTRAKGGTGLGLNISKTIIEKLGGTLNFVSQPDAITTFYFDLPVWTGSEKNEIKPIEKIENTTENLRLLICEDDDQQARYLAKLLEASGFVVDIANNVPQAKQFLLKSNYHALLLDLILPGEDGISFIRELNENDQTHKLPIIVLSVIAETGHHILSDENVSVEDWLSKPINFDKLLSAIQHIKHKTYPAKPTILYVEDDASTFKFVKALLNEDAEVVSAGNIKEALDQIEHNKFNLILLDLILPDGNSETILPQLEKYHVPIIIYSGIKVKDDLGKIVKHVLLKSETSNEKLLNLIKLELKTMDKVYGNAIPE